MVATVNDEFWEVCWQRIPDDCACEVSGAVYSAVELGFENLVF